MNPFISIIVPVYNAEKTLRQCVESILSQEFSVFELFLIDDGSKDSSPRICDEYALRDERVKVLHKENGGVSSARNMGLDYAKGEWITFVDSDDYLEGNYFGALLGAEDDLLITDFCHLSGGDIIDGYLPSIKECSSIQKLFDTFANSLLKGPVFKFYKRSLLHSIRFEPVMRIGEDTHFVLNYLTRCSRYNIVTGGRYVIRVSETEPEKKYAVTVDYAVRSLQYLKDAYDGLVQTHHINKGIFLSYIGYFKRISQADWRQEKARWYDNDDVKALYDYVWPALSVKQKVRLVASRMLRR